MSEAWIRGADGGLERGDSPKQPGSRNHWGEGLPLNLGWGSLPHPNTPWDPLGISPIKATYKGVEGSSDTQLLSEGTPACLPFLLLYLQGISPEVPLPECLRKGRPTSFSIPRLSLISDMRVGVETIRIHHLRSPCGLLLAQGTHPEVLTDCRQTMSWSKLIAINPHTFIGKRTCLIGFN